MPKKREKSYSQRNRPQLERICMILRRIQKGGFPNRRVLSEECSYDEKTIQRDVNFMRDRANLPIKYDPHRHGYYLTEPVAHFPLIQISEGELVSVFIAQKALQQYHGTPFEQPLRQAFKKLVTSLTGEISVAWSDLESAISFRSIETNPADTKIFQTVSLAAQQCFELELVYRKLESPEFEKRRVRPYHMACINNQWYLFAFDTMRQAVRTFVLPRMKSAKALKATFKKPSEFSIDKFLKGSFGVFSSTGKYEVLIQFDAFAAQLIRERTWHHSQRIKELARGRLELSLTLTSLKEIESWIQSWGKHALVIAPNDLRKTIAENARGVSRLYE
jgi:proteasome accessory factor B